MDGGEITELFFSEASGTSIALGGSRSQKTEVYGYISSVSMKKRAGHIYYATITAATGTV